MSVNKAILLGRLGADPELKYGQSGKPVLRFRMATSERWVDKGGEKQERTEWHTVICFGNRAEGLSKHLEKGAMVFVEGRIQTRSWDDKDGNKRYATEIVLTDLQFAGGGKGSGHQSGGQSKASEPDDVPSGGDFGDDDIPF